jgi:phage-related protein
MGSIGDCCQTVGNSIEGCFSSVGSGLSCFSGFVSESCSTIGSGIATGCSAIGNGISSCCGSFTTCITSFATDTVWPCLQAVWEAVRSFFAACGNWVMEHKEGSIGASLGCIGGIVATSIAFWFFCNSDENGPGSTGST